MRNHRNPRQTHCESAPNPRLSRAHHTCSHPTAPLQKKDAQTSKLYFAQQLAHAHARSGTRIQSVAYRKARRGLRTPPQKKITVSFADPQHSPGGMPRDKYRAPEKYQAEGDWRVESSTYHVTLDTPADRSSSDMPPPCANRPATRASAGGRIVARSRVSRHCGRHGSSEYDTTPTCHRLCIPFGDIGGIYLRWYDNRETVYSIRRALLLSSCRWENVDRCVGVRE